ncbi:MAG TPA: RNA polymerase sigma factor [Anaerolineales bacterium]|nr:RNA polymerase sigma factor [Anaerolineales bacterium]
MAQQPFETLVEMHRDEIFAYLWRLIPDDQAEDCLQETFLRAFRAYERTAPDSNYRAWLYKIATNVARTAHTRRRREMTREPYSPVAPGQLTPLETVTFHEDLNEVLQAVEALPHKQRAAMMMRKYQDMDYEDIGAALECSAATARAHVYQALKKLRVRLARGFERSMEAE